MILLIYIAYCTSNIAKIGGRYCTFHMFNLKNYIIIKRDFLHEVKSTSHVAWLS